MYRHYWQRRSVVHHPEFWPVEKCFVSNFYFLKYEIRG